MTDSVHMNSAEDITPSQNATIQLTLLSIAEHRPGLFWDELMEVAQSTFFYDYFQVADNISHLVNRKLITLSQDKGEVLVDAHGVPRRRAYLTPTGHSVLEQLSGQLPLPVQNQIAHLSQAKAIEQQRQSSWRPDGRSFQVTLSVQDSTNLLLEIKLQVPSEEKARRYCKAWKDQADALYQDLILRLESLTTN